MCLRHDGASWLEHPCLFFELTRRGLQLRPAAVEPARGRHGALAHPARRPDGGIPADDRPRRAGDGLRLGGRAYVRPKQTPDERLSPYYSLRNVSMMRECPLGDELYTPRLAETVRDTLHALLPLYEFCLSAVDDRQRLPRCPLCCRGGACPPAAHLQSVQAAVKMANAPICHCERPQATRRPERAARGSALGVQSREGTHDFADSFPRCSRVLRDSHVASLLGMTNLGACQNFCDFLQNTQIDT